MSLTFQAKSLGTPCLSQVIRNDRQCLIHAFERQGWWSTVFWKCRVSREANVVLKHSKMPGCSNQGRIDMLCMMVAQ